MKNVFQNKKVLIAMIVAIVVIVIAILAFVVLGINKKNKSNTSSTIKFDDETSSENVTDVAGVSSNTTSNNTNSSKSIKVEDDIDIDEDIDEFYKTAAEKLAKGFTSEEDMSTFLDDCVDIKAYVAYDAVKDDDSKFFDEYCSISDDDERITQVKESFLSIPSIFQMSLSFIDYAQELSESNSTDDTANVTVGEFSEEDKELKLTKIAGLEQSEGDDNITSVTVTYRWLGEDASIIMYFYGDIVIYIGGEDGESMLDSSDILSDIEINE